MKKIISLLLLLCLLPKAGAEAENRELVPISINYILDGRVIYTARRILVDENADILPESLRKSFSEEYVPDDNNSWEIKEGIANITLRRSGGIPQTGDTEGAAFWTAVFISAGVCGAAAAIVLLHRRKIK